MSIPDMHKRTEAPAAPPMDREGRFTRDPDVPPPPPPPSRNWRGEVLATSGLNALIGIWMIVAGWVIYDGPGDAAWNAWWVGGVVLILAAARVSRTAFWQSWMSYVNAFVGAWLFASAWWLDVSNAAQWNDIACGAVIFALALLSASATDTAARLRAWRRR